MTERRFPPPWSIEELGSGRRALERLELHGLRPQFPLRCFARFCTSDRFLRLAMITPRAWLVSRGIAAAG
jgi:hypothetical protein